MNHFINKHSYILRYIMFSLMYVYNLCIFEKIISESPLIIVSSVLVLYLRIFLLYKALSLKTKYKSKKIYCVFSCLITFVLSLLFFCTSYQKIYLYLIFEILPIYVLIKMYTLIKLISLKQFFDDYTSKKSKIHVIITSKSFLEYLYSNKEQLPPDNIKFYILIHLKEHYSTKYLINNFLNIEFIKYVKSSSNSDCILLDNNTNIFYYDYKKGLFLEE